MKCTYLMSVLTILSGGPVWAQAPDTLWTRTFGGAAAEEANCVQQTTDAGYILAGYTESFGAGGPDVWLVKTNSSGNITWAKTCGGIGIDIAYSAEQTTDGGYVVVGETDSYGSGSNDVWLIRTNPSGDTLWTRTFGTASSERGRSVQQTADGGFIVAAEFSDNIVLIKTDSSGNMLWNRPFGGTRGWSVRQTRDSGYVVVGRGMGSPRYDLALFRADTSGFQRWSRRYDTGGDEYAYAVQQSADGGYVMVGYVDIPTIADLVLVRTDSAGNATWIKTYGGSNNDIGRAVRPTADGGYIVAGSTQSFGAGGYDVWLLKFNTAGDTLWTKTIGGASPDVGRSVDLCSDGGYMIAGYTQSYGAGSSDCWLIRTRPPVEVEERRAAARSQPSFLVLRGNPVRNRVVFELTLRKATTVSLRIYDLAGRLVGIPFSGHKGGGSHRIVWQPAPGLKAGVYFCRAEAGGQVETVKMVKLQ